MLLHDLYCDISDFVVFTKIAIKNSRKTNKILMKESAFWLILLLDASGP